MDTMWKVTSCYINGEALYAVYRNLYNSEIDHSGNREYATGYMKSQEEAQKIADKLNSGRNYICDDLRTD